MKGRPGSKFVKIAQGELSLFKTRRPRWARCWPIDAAPGERASQEEQIRLRKAAA